ncbi:hypothetical protein DAEQUDRAFT_737007 [Daedalea quercina L-15889]|uniref:HMG box domain-containing protein n=1 Tax=Daedalea quercina L-15889 TaxID=1314783 RepID=A0A165RVU9_9APHY|nr:hypothetical protein DAEQUDRAFT_737007 [Daedalea quercina L-15889]
MPPILATRSFLLSSLPLLAPTRRDGSNAGKVPAKAGGKSKKAVKKPKEPKKTDRKKRSKEPVMNVDLTMKVVVKVKRSDMPPSRPAPSRLLFASDYIKRQSSTGASGIEKLRVAFDEWSSLDDVSRQAWRDRCKALWAEYPKRLAEWYQNTDKETLKAVKRHFKKKGRHLPKNPHRVVRPSTGYMRYLLDYFKTCDLSGPLVPAFLTQGAKNWQSLSDEEKAPYLEAARRERTEYYRKTGRTPPPP